MVSCGKAYYCNECTDLRLLADQYCDEVEAAKFIRTEMRIWKDYQHKIFFESLEKRYSNLRNWFSSIVPKFEVKKEETPKKQTSTATLQNPILQNIDHLKLSEIKKEISRKSLECDEKK